MDEKSAQQSPTVWTSTPTRRIVLAGTGPSGGAGIDHPAGGTYIYWDMLRSLLARLRERIMNRDGPIAVSRDLHARIPGSTLIIYPGSGHGGVFQHVDDFAVAVRSHLDADD
ncbi:hypothetical protein [Brevibacterium sp. RIT 803]|uniref:alpha/beta fold hydrolase n=1 Tax=Brevibacterium sp. RIT 803 TaxID=2810210 RepID=UPI00194E2BF1|nr:hypothetical protein [Brevibacterium sp. RIT 803]MBM6591400.1 hypothetical protein [Brevibacterium sp. RIT 803]